MALYLDTTVQTAKVSLRAPRIGQRGRIVSYVLSCLGIWKRRPAVPTLVTPVNPEPPLGNHLRFDNRRPKNKN
jgi:hypothetical protein